MSRAIPVILAAAVLAGCGAGGDRTPAVGKLPLAPGARVAVRVRTCDPGLNAFCAVQLVVEGGHYDTALNMLGAENGILRRSGWTLAAAPLGSERAADSHNDRLRVTFATAAGDLEAIDLGSIKRARPVTLALSRALFAHRSALSMLLEVGAG
jgi:hypothetical protein